MSYVQVRCLELAETLGDAIAVEKVLRKGLLTFDWPGFPSSISEISNFGIVKWKEE